MRLPTTSDRCSTLNLTPMIDVVFQLIVFFLLSSHFAQQESQAEVNLPPARSGSAEKPSDRPRVTISVLADGAMLLAGETIDAAELERRLSAEAANHGEKLEVLIRADRRAPYRTVEPILLTCAKLNIWQVSLGVLKPTG